MGESGTIGGSPGSATATAGADSTATAASSTPRASLGGTSSPRFWWRPVLRVSSRPACAMLCALSSLSLLLSVAVIHMLAMASPGPNVLVVTQTAMARPRRDALAVAVGVACGSLVLATGAAVGLGLAIEQVSWVRGTIQVAGGLYLVYLGILTWRGAREPPPRLELGEASGAGRFLRRGILTNLTNPKAAVFFGSILAPVLDQATSGWIVAAAVAVVVVNALWWHCLLAVLFSRAGVRRWYGRAKLVIDRVVGAGLGLLGIRLALEPV